MLKFLTPDLPYSGGAKSFWSRRLDLVQTVVVAVEVVNDDDLEICILTLDAERVAVVNKA
ncbi:MAG: hypothetical protein ACE5G1_13920 [bacterium]